MIGTAPRQYPQVLGERNSLTSDKVAAEVARLGASAPTSSDEDWIYETK